MTSPAARVASCPHCQHPITEAEAFRLHAQVRAARRVNPGRTPTLAPCKYCGKEMGARERRAHEPHCPEKP